MAFVSCKAIIWPVAMRRDQHDVAAGGSGDKYLKCHLLCSGVTERWIALAVITSIQTKEKEYDKHIYMKEPHYRPVSNKIARSSMDITLEDFILP